MGIVKSMPEGAKQHATAGPYSPVLEVQCEKLVVISGQVAVNSCGEVVGNTIEEQTRATLENCKTQLGYAGCGLEDVFKVNIYLSDLGQWGAMNAIYTEMMPEPRPVRTTVQAALLPGYIIEVEMWAAKK